jgi:hypothetical protein
MKMWPRLWLDHSVVFCVVVKVVMSMFSIPQILYASVQRVKNDVLFLHV